jgi:periplasmic protein TonB
MAHRWATIFCLGLMAAAAHAQFAMVPQPVRLAPGALQASQALNERAYRVDAARHIYAAYPSRIMQGMMPPLMHAVLVTETEVDAKGAVTSVRIVRAPATAKEVTPWVVQLIRRAAPLPPPARMGKVRYVEIWLVDKSGKFQVHTLTEGQR